MPVCTCPCDEAGYETKGGATDREGRLKLKKEVRLPDSIPHFDRAGGKLGEC